VLVNLSIHPHGSPIPPPPPPPQEYLLHVTLELLSDPVPNVRLAAATLLPAMKQSIRLPEDVEQLVGARAGSG